MNASGTLIGSGMTRRSLSLGKSVVHAVEEKVNTLSPRRVVGPMEDVAVQHVLRTRPAYSGKEHVATAASFQIVYRAQTDKSIA